MLYRSAQLHAFTVYVLYTETSKSLHAPPKPDKTIIGRIWILLEAKGGWPWYALIQQSSPVYSKFEFAFVLAGTALLDVYYRRSIGWHIVGGCDTLKALKHWLWQLAHLEVTNLCSDLSSKTLQGNMMWVLMLRTHFFMSIPPTPGTLKRACIQWDNASLPFIASGSNLVMRLIASGCTAISRCHHKNFPQNHKAWNRTDLPSSKFW